MTFELKDGRYHIALWVLEYSKGNVLISVFRDSPTDKWTALMRFRTYVDDKVFNSADPKQWFQTTFPADMPESEVERQIDSSIPDKLITAMPDWSEGVKSLSVKKLSIHSDDAQVAANVLRRDPGMHAAHGTKDSEGNSIADLDTYDSQDEIWDSMGNVDIN